jgi:hypothetical protein
MENLNILLMMKDNLPLQLRVSYSLPSEHGDDWQTFVNVRMMHDASMSVFGIQDSA